MGSIYEARWKEAVRQAQRIQDYLDRGYLVMDGDHRVFNMSITSEFIFERWNDVGSGRYWFRNDLSLDAGLFTKVKDIRNNFRRLKVFKPVKR